MTTPSDTQWKDAFPMPFGTGLSGDLRIKFSCACGKRLKVPAGRKSRVGPCPKCGRQLDRPEADPDRILQVLCPCGAELSPDMRLCPRCGLAVFTRTAADDVPERVDADLSSGLEDAGDDPDLPFKDTALHDSGRQRRAATPAGGGADTEACEPPVGAAPPALQRPPAPAPRAAAAPPQAAAAPAEDGGLLSRIQRRDWLIFFATGLVYLAYTCYNEYVDKPRLKARLQAQREVVRQFRVFEERLLVRDAATRAMVPGYRLAAVAPVPGEGAAVAADDLRRTPPLDQRDTALPGGEHLIRWIAVTPWSFEVTAPGYAPARVVLDGEARGVRTVDLDRLR